MTESMVITVAQLKAQTLPALFNNPATIASYGNSLISTSNIDQLSALMEAGSLAKLASSIAEILTKMADASPEKISKPPTWLERMLGGGLEKHVRYQVARKTFEQLLEQAERHACGVRKTEAGLTQLIASHASESERLKAHIQAGHEFLNEHPVMGALESGALEFDRPRERFARKLANLAALLASHELSVNQMKLSRAKAIDMLDRFGETVSVLVPVWRQHTLTLITTKNMSADMVAEASKAHQALMASLSSSLAGLNS